MIFLNLFTWKGTYIIYWVGRTGWRRLIGCLKLQVIFRKRATNYRALLRKMTYEDKASYDFTPPCSWRRADTFGWKAPFDRTSTRRFSLSSVPSSRRPDSINLIFLRIHQFWFFLFFTSNVPLQMYGCHEIALTSKDCTDVQCAKPAGGGSSEDCCSLVRLWRQTRWGSFVMTWGLHDL